MALPVAVIQGTAAVVESVHDFMAVAQDFDRALKRIGQWEKQAIAALRSDVEALKPGGLTHLLHAFGFQCLFCVQESHTQANK